MPAGGHIRTGPSTSTARSSACCCPQRRDLAAARRFFTRALRAGTIPAEVTTDRAPAYPRVLDELIPSALQTVERYANNPVETDHGRAESPAAADARPETLPVRADRGRRARVRPEPRRGHYELATDVPARHRIHETFDQLAIAI
jgi:transposase, IS6 family